MSKGIENDFKDHCENGRDQDYLLTKEENLVLLGILYLDLKNICQKIDDNFNSTGGSSF